MTIKDLSKNLSEYRLGILCFAIIWILLFHIVIITDNKIVQTFCYNGFGGVDIFLFMSGWGIYHSLNKNFNIKEFYKKRIVRLMPQYIVILVLKYAVIYYKAVHSGNIVEFKMLLKDFFFNASLLTPFFPNQVQFQFNWYIFCIFYMYLVSPAIYRVLTKFKGKGYTFVLLVCIIVYCFSVGSAYLFYTCRTFSYTLGMYVGYLEYNKPSLRISSAIPFLLIFIGFYIRNYPYSNELYLKGKYGFELLAMSIAGCGITLFLSTYIFPWVYKSRLFKSIICAIGKSTYEIYLISFSFTLYICDIFYLLFGQRNIVRIIIVIINIVSGITINVLYKIIINKTTDYKKKNITQH